MKKELIGKATRNEFREVLTSFTLREIEMIFESAGMSPNMDFIPPVSGQRRTLVEQYYANIDFGNASHVRNAASAFEELILQLKALPDHRWGEAGRQKVLNTLLDRMQRDGFRYEDGRFLSENLRVNALETPSIIALTQESITEHVEKARTKIDNDDFAGAITNAYTLVEEFLKETLRHTGTPFKESEGDIKSLYNSIADPLNLNPKGENLESHLKTILQGLKSQITGLYEVANKASDRHARKYKPARHHAKLAVNSALTLCEFILDSYEYQQQMKGKQAKG